MEGCAHTSLSTTVIKRRPLPFEADVMHPYMLVITRAPTTVDERTLFALSRIDSVDSIQHEVLSLPFKTKESCENIPLELKFRLVVMDMYLSAKK